VQTAVADGADVQVAHRGSGTGSAEQDEHGIISVKGYLSDQMEF